MCQNNEKHLSIVRAGRVVGSNGTDIWRTVVFQIWATVLGDDRGVESLRCRQRQAKQQDEGLKRISRADDRLGLTALPYDHRGLHVTIG